MGVATKTWSTWTSRRKIHRVSGRENISTILDKLEALLEIHRQLDRNVNRQLAMEVLLLKLAA